MEKYHKLYDTLLPRYARKPLLIVLCFQLLFYFGTKPLILLLRLPLHYLSTPLDDRLPLIPAFIFIYVLAFAQWVFGYIIIARDSPERCYRILAGELMGKLIVLLIYLLYPTAIEHSRVEVTGFTTWLLNFIWLTDTPTINLFPSTHCFMSWLCFRGALGLKRMPRWYAWLQLGFSLLVFASTLLVKQHVWPDILGGIAVAELGQLLGRLLRAERIFRPLDKRTKE